MLWVGLRKGCKWQERVSFPPVFMSWTPWNSGYCLKIAPEGVEGGLKIFGCVCWSFDQCYNDNFVCLLEAQTKWQWESNADNNRSWQRRLIVSNYGWIQYHVLDPPYFRVQNWGALLVTNVIRNTYCTMGINPYWALTHWANPNHRTPW